MRRVQASDHQAGLSEAYQHQGTRLEDYRRYRHGLQPHLLHYRHGHEGQGAGAFTIPEAKGEVRQAHQQTEERHLLQGGVL